MKHSFIDIFNIIQYKMSQLSHYSRKSMSCHSGSQFRSTIKKNIQSIGYHNEVNDFSSTLNQLE